MEGIFWVQGMFWFLNSNGTGTKCQIGAAKGTSNFHIYIQLRWANLYFLRHIQCEVGNSDVL